MTDRRTTASNVREHDKFMLRLPEGMRELLKVAAEKSGRSMNAEIVARLETSAITANVIDDYARAEERLMEQVKLERELRQQIEMLQQQLDKADKNGDWLLRATINHVEQVTALRETAQSLLDWQRLGIRLFAFLSHVAADRVTPDIKKMMDEFAAPIPNYHAVVTDPLERDDRPVKPKSKREHPPPSDQR